MSKFIGEKEIINFTEEGDKVVIGFKDQASTVTMNKSLFEAVVKDAKGNGEITDCVRDFLARKILAELAYYDLDFYMISHIAVGIETLAHNLREDIIGKTFNCTGASDIKIKKLLD
jgi:hypothetical protein